MAVKAIAQIDQIQWESATTFQAVVRWVLLSSTESQGTFQMTGISAGILAVLFEQAVIAEVKSQLGLGLLDQVRLVGATLV